MLSEFLSHNQFSNMNTGRLFESIESNLPREITFNFEIFVNNWFKSTGVNTLEVKFDTSSEVINAIEVHQTSVQEDEPLRARKTNIAFFYQSQCPPHIAEIIIKPIAVSLVSLPQKIRTPDAVLLNFYDSDYCKVLMSEKNASFLMRNTHQISHSVARGVLYRTVFELAYSSKINPLTVISLLMKNYEAEQYEQGKTHLYHLRKIVLRLLQILPEKQARVRAKTAFPFFFNFYLETKDESEKIELFEDLISFSGSLSEVCTLFAAAKREKMIPLRLQWELMAKAMENGFWNQEIDSFEKSLQALPRSQESLGHSFLKEASNAKGKQAETLYKDLIDDKSDTGFLNQIFQMRGLNCKTRRKTWPFLICFGRTSERFTKQEHPVSLMLF